MPVYDADAPAPDQWAEIKKMSVDRLWSYPGEIIPWPPSDSDVLWRAWLMGEFWKHGKIRRTEKSWSSHRTISGMFGEYYFGLKFGLKGNTFIWEKNYRVDYQTPIGSVDVKSIVNPNHRLLRQVNQPKFADILVLALVDMKAPSLKTVSLLGWCYDTEIIKAPIEYFSRTDPERWDAHYFYPNQLKEISEMERMMGINKPTLPREPHWVEYKDPKPAQPKLF